jgi:hypothetical protein
MPTIHRGHNKIGPYIVEFITKSGSYIEFITKSGPYIEFITKSGSYIYEGLQSDIGSMR